MCVTGHLNRMAAPEKPETKNQSVSEPAIGSKKIHRWVCHAFQAMMRFWTKQETHVLLEQVSGVTKNLFFKKNI